MSEILEFKTKAQNEEQYKFLCKECIRRKTCTLPYKNWEMENCDWRDTVISETTTQDLVSI